jgi:hypothetical protein
MTYKEKQRQYQVSIRDALFHDPGFGYYRNNIRPEVLQNPELNLWEGIQEDALAYFRKNKISWHKGGSKPTGHLLSSQVSCVNHLFYLRQREELSTAVLKAIDPSITKALQIDSGFVEFEKVGKRRLGKEKNLSRGANCTSIDALMLGQRRDQSIVLVLIEWKFTEDYSSTKKDLSHGNSGKTRIDAYADLLLDPDCPIAHTPVTDLYFEPFYQLMRQTLLG